MRRLPYSTLAVTLAVAVSTAWGQERVERRMMPREASPTSRVVTNGMLLNGRSNPDDWLMYGRDYSNQRWSPLAQVNRQNVRRLQAAWVYQTGIAKLGSFETSPLIVGNVMYLTTPYGGAMAIDAATGHEMWRYEYKSTVAAPIYCCGPNNRGFAVSDTTLYLGTLDAHLVALDTKTGTQRWSVQIADPEAGYSETMAPLVIGDEVIIGTSGAEYGIRGFVRAYDKNTGKELWNWYTIPGPEEGGWWGKWATTTPSGETLNRDIAAEKADSARYADAWKRGGGSVWMTPAYDPDTKLLYVSIGNPSPDLDGAVRPGDDLYTESVVALNATTGKLVWHFQEVPHGVWDLDAVSPPVLVTLSGGRKAVIEAGKTGWVYVLDAATGKLIRRSQGFVRHENLFAQPTAPGVRMLPGANGGSEWSPMAVNPNIDYAYVLGLEQPMTYSTHRADYEKGALWLGSAFKAVAGERQYGTFTAIDLNSGKVAWQAKTPQPMIGGALATAGNLVFTGEGDGNFDAFDAKSGKKLWMFHAGAGCNAPPVSYMVAGRQFIAVACGGNYQLGYRRGDAVFAFALPGGPMGAERGKFRRH